MIETSVKVEPARLQLVFRVVRHPQARASEHTEAFYNVFYEFCRPRRCRT